MRSTRNLDTSDIIGCKFEIMNLLTVDGQLELSKTIILEEISSTTNNYLCKGFAVNGIQVWSKL